MPTGESKRVWSTFFIKFWRIKTINHKQKKEAKKHYRKVVRKRDKVLVTILKENLGILWSMNLSEWNWREKDFWAGNGCKNPCEYKRNVTIEYYMVTLYLLLFSWHHCSLFIRVSAFFFHFSLRWKLKVSLANKNNNQKKLSSKPLHLILTVMFCRFSLNSEVKKNCDLKTTHNAFWGCCMLFLHFFWQFFFKQQYTNCVMSDSCFLRK